MKSSLQELISTSYFASYDITVIENNSGKIMLYINKENIKNELIDKINNILKDFNHHLIKVNPKMYHVEPM